MKLLILISFCAITLAYEITNLKVPLYADPRREAELSCHFKMDDQKLHSVKWYRDMHEIFRYSPTQEPRTRVFNITGVVVQGGDCFAEYCVIRVMPHPVATRASYSCEVSTEGPKFQIVRETKHMTVVAMPQKDPLIVGAPKLVKPGEQLQLNCSSDYSLPPSDIEWYVDNELQKQEPWHRTELSPPRSGGLQASWRPMRFTVPTTASGTLRIRCDAVVRVEPPVVTQSTSIITVYSLTQLSKYVSNKGITTEYSTDSSNNSWVHVPTWTLIIISIYLSL